MKLPKQYLVYAAFGIWGLMSMALTLLLFFPYQKTLGMLSRSLLGSGRISVAAEGTHFGFAGAEASRILVGHAALEGRPVLEFRKAEAHLKPWPLLAGRLMLTSSAAAYDGTVACEVTVMPLAPGMSSSVKLTFSNINLAKYPEGSLPWLKGITGTLSGWIREEAPVDTPEKRKGSFRITVLAGELKELHVKGAERVVLPYKEISAEGRITGTTTYVDRIVLSGVGIALKGNGSIERVGGEHLLNLRLAKQNGAEASILPDGSIVRVTGSQWHPVVTIEQQKTASAVTPSRPGERAL